MQASLTLSLGGFSVTFDKFLADQIPRIDPNENTSSYSAYGTPGLTGISYEPPRLWTVNAVCAKEQADDLTVIWMESDWRRRHHQDWRITVDDRTYPEMERSTRTRAIVPSTTEETITKSGLTYIKFFSRYYGWITKRSEYRKLGEDWGVIFTVQEQGKYFRVD